jgi:hypothetical protein
MPEVPKKSGKETGDVYANAPKSIPIQRQIKINELCGHYATFDNGRSQDSSVA